MTTPSTTRRQRLERAGYIHVDGWLPERYAKRVLQQIEMHREDVEQIEQTAGKPGRPPKKDA